MKAAFRVDASAAIGTGHFMRCLTLADALRRQGGEALFLSRHLPGHLREMLAGRGHGVALLSCSEEAPEAGAPAHAGWLGTSQRVDAEASLKALAGQAWDWLVVDHYALDTRWESALRPTAGRILAIDDLADRRHDCDLLLDQNYYADLETRYEGLVPGHCRLLLGPRHALLREEFARLRESVRPRQGPAHRILVFFGGVDAGNHTAKAIAALAGLPVPALAVDVVIGAQHPARAEIEAACARHGYACHVQTANMAELMAQADLAVGAGGTACWERCCLGLPAFALCLADNQRQLLEDAARAGLVYAPDSDGDEVAWLARHLQALSENTALRTLLSANGMAAVDGGGAARVLRAMAVPKVTVRPAGPQDSTDIFAWRNHPSVREVSRHRDPIDPGSHESWLGGVLADPERALLMGRLEDGQALGVVRFDLEGELAEISIYIDPGRKGQGLGGALLASAERWLAANRPGVERIRAEVLGGNAPSHNLFKAGGYAMDSAHYSKKVHNA